VGAGHQADVLEAKVDLLERSLELRLRPGLVHAGVDEDDPGSGGDRPSVAVRHSLVRKREPQPPEAWEHPLTASELASARHQRHDIEAA
jgi:hypothetical protein